MIHQGDLGPNEGKTRIFRSRSLGEVLPMDFPEQAQKARHISIPCESPQKVFTENLSIIRNMPGMGLLNEFRN